MRAAPADFEKLALRAHSLLWDVPLHDVWSLELPGGGPGRTIQDLRALLRQERLAEGNPVVRLLFALRSWLGRLFRWDDPSRRAPSARSYAERLSAEERERSLVTPGTPEGPFTALLVTPREAISEIVNATVHAFSVFALEERPGGYRLYWAVYVRPVGWLTSWYMRLIDPFRRLVVYPAMLRHIRRRWVETS